MFPTLAPTAVPEPWYAKPKSVKDGLDQLIYEEERHEQQKALMTFVRADLDFSRRPANDKTRRPEDHRIEYPDSATTPIDPFQEYGELHNDEPSSPVTRSGD